MTKTKIDWDAIKPIPGFDAVRMKNEIQARIYEETKDMSPEEEREYRQHRRDRFRQNMERFSREEAEMKGGDSHEC